MTKFDLIKQLLSIQQTKKHVFQSQPPSFIPILAAQHSSGRKGKYIALQLGYCPNDTLAEGFTGMFAYEIKVCMFRNANVFSLVRELHITEKAAPWKLCRAQQRS